MIELPVPDCAAHIGGQHPVDQIVVERVEIVVRHHPGKPGGIDEDVGAAELLPDRRGDLAYLGGVFERQMHRPVEAGVSAAGQLADHRVGALNALVVADDDARSRLGKKPRTGGADPAAGAGDHRNLAAEILANRHPTAPRVTLA